MGHLDTQPVESPAIQISPCLVDGFGGSRVACYQANSFNIKSRLTQSNRFLVKACARSQGSTPPLAYLRKPGNVPDPADDEGPPPRSIRQNRHGNPGLRRQPPRNIPDAAPGTPGSIQFDCAGFPELLALADRHPAQAMPQKPSSKAIARIRWPSGKLLSWSSRQRIHAASGLPAVHPVRRSPRWKNALRQGCASPRGRGIEIDPDLSASGHGIKSATAGMRDIELQFTFLGFACQRRLAELAISKRNFLRFDFQVKPENGSQNGPGCDESLPVLLEPKAHRPAVFVWADGFTQTPHNRIRMIEFGEPHVNFVPAQLRDAARSTPLDKAVG